MRWIGMLVLGLILVSCSDPIEERAANEYARCAAEYGLEAGMIGVTRGPGGGFAITAPDLPQPAADECLRRLNAILRSE